MLLVANVDNTQALVIGPHILTIQPALSPMELQILRELNRAGQVKGFMAFCNNIGMGYPYAGFLLARLENRGLVEVCRNGGQALIIKPLARVANG